MPADSSPTETVWECHCGLLLPQTLTLFGDVVAYCLIATLAATTTTLRKQRASVRLASHQTDGDAAQSQAATKCTRPRWLTWMTTTVSMFATTGYYILTCD